MDVLISITGTQRVDGCGGALLSDGHIVLDGISQED